jgi:hypothetical protein
MSIFRFLPLLYCVFTSSIVVLMVVVMDTQTSLLLVFRRIFDSILD